MDVSIATPPQQRVPKQRRVSDSPLNTLDGRSEPEEEPISVPARRIILTKTGESTIQSAGTSSTDGLPPDPYDIDNSPSVILESTAALIKNMDRRIDARDRKLETWLRPMHEDMQAVKAKVNKLNDGMDKLRAYTDERVNKIERLLHESRPASKSGSVIERLLLLLLTRSGHG